jgi:hypothetical protein
MPTIPEFAIRWDNPIFQGYQPPQIRRGSREQLQQYIANTGELLYSDSTQQLYIGDDETPGGLLLTGGGGGIGNNFDFGTILQPLSVITDFGSI